jgi:hypothetical protein
MIWCSGKELKLAVALYPRSQSRTHCAIALEHGRWVNSLLWCSDAFPFALTRLFFQALNQPIKIHVSSGLCAEGDAAKINFEHKQHATRDLIRRLQQQGRLMGQAAGSAAPPAGWPQFGNLTGIEGWPQVWL